MRLAALILGIIGGVFGLGGAACAVGVGAVGSAFGAEGGKTVLGLGVAAFPLAVAGLVGGAIAMVKPLAAGIILVVSGIGIIIAISAGGAVPGVLLIIGGIFALVGRKRQTKAS